MNKSLKRVRILVAGMSNMLANIVTAVLAQIPGMLVVGSIGEGEHIASGIRHTSLRRADNPGERPRNADDFLPLLRQFPSLKVVAVAGGAGDGFLHELRPHSVPLPELSAEVLQIALRGTPAPKPH